MPGEVQVTPIGPQLGLGEGPHWDAKTNTLYYVDMPKSAIHRYVPHKNEHSCCEVEGGHISFVIPVEGKESSDFVIGSKRAITHVTWDLTSNRPSSSKVLAEAEEDRGKNQVNDGKVDPMGRLWTGSLIFGSAIEKSGFESHLYSFDERFRKTTHLSNIGISNGLAWSLDHKRFFYIDTITYKVQAFDYHKSNGTIGNGRTIFDFKSNSVEGFPDGMTIDSEGKLWVAVFQGGKVIRIDPDTGELLYTLPIPSPEVTSVAFGGPNLDELYVTTGSGYWSKDLPLDKFPFAGHTFKVTNLGVKGTPSLSIKLF